MRFETGDRVEYFSISYNSWIPAEVLGWNSELHCYILNIQAVAAPHKVRKAMVAFGAEARRGPDSWLPMSWKLRFQKGTVSGFVESQNRVPVEFFSLQKASPCRCSSASWSLAVWHSSPMDPAPGSFAPLPTLWIKSELWWMDQRHSLACDDT
eukprot:symbB.v1.2.010989.t1/scaffold725.1/size168906/15